MASAEIFLFVITPYPLRGYSAEISGAHCREMVTPDDCQGFLSCDLALGGCGALPYAPVFKALPSCFAFSCSAARVVS